jgi:hypothetical protein
MQLETVNAEVASNRVVRRATARAQDIAQQAKAAAQAAKSAQDTPARRLYTIKEAHRMAGVSRCTLWRYRDQLDVRKIGRRVLITAESLDAFIVGLPSA